MIGARFAAAAVIVAVAGGVLVFASRESEGPGTVDALIDLSSSTSCKQCHPGVYQEWQDSMHAQSFTDPLVLAPEQSNNFRKLDCIPCHAPAPLLEREIGKGARVVERTTFREQGVDCLSCHKTGHTMAATRTLEPQTAPCQPQQDTRLSQAALCAPCHNQHDTVNEWEASPYHEQNVSCLDCHMPSLTRTLADGKKKTGRDHRFLGGHDSNTLKDALGLDYSVHESETGESVFAVTLINEGAGHNYPTDARHRALDLVVTLIQQDGIEVPARETRPFGRENGTARRRFRNPYRQESERLTNRELYGRENTQILAKESATLEVPFQPSQITHARIEVIYKLTPYLEDEEGTMVHERLVELLP